jgi:hypothetical protein
LLTAAGDIYGLTAGGGAAFDGVAYKLSPPAAGSTNWTYTILYSFKGGTDGDEPYSTGLIADPKGNLYGATSSGGVAKQCNKSGCGTVFELRQKNGVWTEQVIYAFLGGVDGSRPGGVMAINSGGNLFGTTEIGGVNKKPWRHSF